MIKMYLSIVWRSVHMCLIYSLKNIIGASECVCVQNPATYFQSWSFSSIIRRNNQKATQEMKESWRLTLCITPFSCNPQKTAWGVNTAWLSDVLLFILSFSVLLLQIVSVRTHLIHGFCFLSLTHTHTRIIIPASDVSLSWSRASITRENDF